MSATVFVSNERILSGRVTSCNNSTDAIAKIKLASASLAEMRAATVNREKMLAALSHVDKDARPLFEAMIPNGQDASDKARATAHMLVRSIVGGIRKHLDRYEDSYFLKASDAELQAALEYAEKLYKTFPQAFPVPQSEKSA